MEFQINFQSGSNVILPGYPLGPLPDDSDDRDLDDQQQPGLPLRQCLPNTSDAGAFSHTRKPPRLVRGSPLFPRAKLLADFTVRRGKGPAGSQVKPQVSAANTEKDSHVNKCWPFVLPRATAF